MDKIRECVFNFEKLISIKYRFVVSKKRKTREIILSFLEADLFHLAGLHYLTDIAISRDRDRVIDEIRRGVITDSLLQKSNFFYGTDREERNVARRIEELRFLREYLETDNFIYIFELRNTGIASLIDAEYVIKSKLCSGKAEVFIFLRKRNENEEYGIVSFFVKNNVEYEGVKLYWMLKERIPENGNREVIYRHPNYIVETP